MAQMAASRVLRGVWGEDVDEEALGLVVLSCSIVVVSLLALSEESLSSSAKLSAVYAPMSNTQGN